MQSLIEYAKRAAVRKVVYVVVGALLAALFALFGGQAKAQIGPNIYTSKSAAVAACQAEKDKHKTSNDYLYGGGRPEGDACVREFDTGNGYKGVRCMVTASGGYACTAKGMYFNWGTSCPAGQTYNASLGKCQTQCDAGSFPDPSNPGQCLNDSKCLAKNVDQLGVGSRMFKERCVAGCMLKWQGDDGSASTAKTEMFNPNGTSLGVQTVYTGHFQYTGACSMDDTPPDLKTMNLDEAKASENECVQMGTQTACMRSDGKVCASASTGKEFCWSPHSTGEKTQDNILQKKSPGDQPGPESIALNNGDTATKAKDDVTIKQTKDGRTSTTTVSTYGTVSGANAGSKNQGTTAGSGTGDGTGSGPGGTCEGEDCEEGESASGGENCEAPPTVSGDPGEQMIALQTWRNRCEAEKRAKDERAFSDDVGSGADGLDPGDASSIWGDGSSSGDLEGNHVGFGSSCPPAPQIGEFSFQWPNGFCDALAAIRMMLIAIAYLWGAGIVMGKD